MHDGIKHIQQLAHTILLKLKHPQISSGTFFTLLISRYSLTLSALHNQSQMCVLALLSRQLRDRNVLLSCTKQRTNVCVLVFLLK